MKKSKLKEDFHASTIKESGDFTASIGRTRPGDKAAIQAPFGRFSYVLGHTNRINVPEGF